MDELREAWAFAVAVVTNWMSIAWNQLAYGVMHKWEVKYFVFAMGTVLVVGLFHIWRRKA